eukprot:GDKI01038787.1.p1 GENE.GDKI01038787.1~~GDKI01038787.1.p1  ORF type:complete len:354 (-),score=46.20 GDKI01038787.1:97-1134(-)
MAHASNIAMQPSLTVQIQHENTAMSPHTNVNGVNVFAANNTTYTSAAAMHSKSQGLTLLLSGTAGICGWMPVHPFDVIKTRMQLSGEGGSAKLYKSTSDAFVTIGKKEGMGGLYSGLSAAVARQATYTTLRAGLYQILRDHLAPEGTNASFATRAAAGLMSGATASIICCPVEVALIRMQADGRLPVAERRGYTHVFNAITRIGREEGVRALWRGSTPTVARAMVVNTVQMASYDQAKDTLTKWGLSGIPLHLSASLTSGFLYCAASLPFDIAKTRMQNQNTPAGQTPVYRNIVQTIARIIQLEGVTSLWKGFLPYFGRGGGHTVFMFLCLEQLKHKAQNAGYNV